MKRINVSSGSEYEKPIGFSRAVRIANIISVAGTAPIAEDGSTSFPGDLYKQTRRCLEIIKEALEKAGSGLEDVVRTRIILTRIEDWEDVIKVRAEYFKKIKPVDTVMQVTRFINPEWLVEIEVDAVVESKSKI